MLCEAISGGFPALWLFSALQDTLSSPYAQVDYLIEVTAHLV